MNELYKGYINSKNKTPIEKFKDVENLKTLDEIRKTETDEWMGVLSEEALLLDFDDEEHAKKALQLIIEYQLKCKVIKTTRGIHVLFKLNEEKFGTASVHKQLACGLVADIKTGKKNGLEVLKFDGIERPTVYDTLEYDEAPYFFYPTKSKSITDFISMVEGDGRNDALFRYIIQLVKIMDKEDAKKTISIINSKIMKEPLSDNELKGLLKDSAYDGVIKKEEQEQFFTEKNQFKFDVFANYLIKKRRVIKIDGQLYIYTDGIYINGGEWIEREMIKHIPMLTKAKRKEVLEYLKLLIEDSANTSEYNQYIAFRNGIYDITEKKLKPFSDKYIITNRIDWDYNEEAYSEIMDLFLNRVSSDDEQIRKILEEMIGYTFFRQNEMGKAFILVGPKANGKSTIQSVLQKLIGTINISSIDLKDLNERFKTAELYGKLANIGDDIGDNYIDDNNMFKTVVTGGRIIAEKKGQDPFEFEPYTKLIYSANNIPKTRDRTGAVKRRLIIVPFDREFKPTDSDYDPYIKYKLVNGTEESSVDNNMSYLINIGLAGLHRVLENNKFTMSAKVQAKINEYDKDNNPIKIWLEEIDVESDIELQPTSDVYNKYIDFCNVNGIKQMSKIEFGKIIKNEIGVESTTLKINGKSVRVYKRREDN